ncbi:MAG TPA: hypothetical protein RMH99_29070, partial [Sandaracinaceae bacterium LLY-WYZ-13_1]|nr:hypothetical protein [Sandaracinaceae bacterium LLY-WYZ-13_1]
GLVGHAIYEDLDAACGPDRRCPAGRQGDIDAGTALVVTSTALTFAAPIAAGVGILLLVLDSGADESDDAAARLVPGPGQVGLAVEGRL